MKQTSVAISGKVKPGFEPVREAFIENLHAEKNSQPPAASTTGVKK